MSLAQLAGDLLLFVRRAREDAALPGEAELRQRLNDGLARFQEQGLAAGFAERDVNDARYALAAAIDEALQFSQWSGRNGWSLHPLGVELFNDRNAGVGFFQRLPQVEKRSAEVTEIYYLAMALGFRGRYHLSEGEEAQRILERLARVVAQPQSGAMSPAPLLPTPPARRESLPWKWVLLGAVLVSLLIFGVLSLSLASGLSELTTFSRQAG